MLDPPTPSAVARSTPHSDPAVMMLVDYDIENLREESSIPVSLNELASMFD